MTTLRASALFWPSWAVSAAAATPAVPLIV
jgi:hypothetical protein